MIYHKNSYFAKIIVGAVLAPAVRLLLLLFPSGNLPRSILRKVPPGVRNIYGVAAQRGYSKEVVLAAATDPSAPGSGHNNPLSRCYSRREAQALFADFKTSETHVRQLYLANFLSERVRRWLERRVGWFLFIRAVK